MRKCRLRPLQDPDTRLRGVACRSRRHPFRRNLQRRPPARLVGGGRSKDEVVSLLRERKYEDVLRHYNTISYVEGRARFTEEGFEVGGVKVQPHRTIIATGASPAAPPIPGMNLAPWLTSTTAMALHRLPASLIVIGGGFVGCELGQMFARAGARVTILCRSRLLPQAEPEISEALTEYLRQEDKDVHCGVAYEAIRATTTGVALSLSNGAGNYVVEGERVLVATGRRPNTSDLGLSNIGIDLGHRGGIRVDDRMRTTRASFYAAGDVTGRDMFVYMAAYGAKIAAENALTAMADAMTTRPCLKSLSPIPRSPGSA